jgi:hypothetical protein
MRQVPNYGDVRNQCFCVHCGGATETRDHAPSRVFLDKPYPAQLPVSPSCERCNQSFSDDELYVACLIECALVGSVEPEAMRREKIARIMRERPALWEKLRKARHEIGKQITFDVESDRVERTLVKLARCHAAYEINEPQLGSPSRVGFAPFGDLSDSAIGAFETPPVPGVFPEVGSRALTRFLGDGGVVWLDVQDGNYRYLVAQDLGVVTVRIVLREHVAAEVIWS